ncbi:LysR substrate-binding domain-containing protein [uncultured Hoeflea sp.]|uniref:LysR substrate-binding domain-containing protein n=1 Tax=uncultured Hoeflea sp. TaxID=538666 RepID=UPI002632D1C1|nr:LysR substrate-binding domain-containing protein [uncultured Hoeflea sp.]
MNNPYRMLPPLGSLVGFEAAARLGGFSLAAEELNVTQSAISHQIRTLEDHLGQPLFLRVGRGIELTDAGADFYKTSAGALEMVRQGVQRLDSYSKPGTVVVKLPPILAAGWLLPRLQQLKADDPGIEPWLFTGTNETELAETEFDIAFQHVPPQHPHEIGEVFEREQRAPLCAPALLEPFEQTPETVPLIHDEEPDDWQKWYGHAGLSRMNFSAGLNFSDPTFALDAASRGLGVYLGNPRWADPWIKDGRLIQAPGPVLESDRFVYAITLERNLQRPAVRSLWNWLRSQAPAADGSAS